MHDLQGRGLRPLQPSVSLPAACYAQRVKSKDSEDKAINVLDKVNAKATKNDIEASHRLGDNRKTIVRFVNRKHSFEALKNKKMLMSVDLTSTGLDKKTNLFLSRNLSDYNDKIAIYC